MEILGRTDRVETHCNEGSSPVCMPQVCRHRLAAYLGTPSRCSKGDAASPSRSVSEGKASLSLGFHMRALTLNGMVGANRAVRSGSGGGIVPERQAQEEKHTHTHTHMYKLHRL